LEKEEEDKGKRASKRKTENIDLHIFSKEMVKRYNSVGIYPPLIDSASGYNFNDDFKFTINVPKDMIIGDFITFLSSLTNIPRENFRIYKFILLNHFQDVTKRFMYNIFPLENFKINNYKIIDIAQRVGLPKPFMLYIHVMGLGNDNLFTDDMFMENIISQEEFIINKETNESIYISPKNIWKLNKLADGALDRVYNSGDNISLIFLKYLKLTPTGFDLIIDDVVAFRNNENVFATLESYGFDTIKERYIKYLPDDLVEDNCTITFELEENSKVSSFENVNCKNIIPLTKDFIYSRYTNPAICVIVNLNWSTPKENFGTSLINVIKETVEAKVNTINVKLKLIVDKPKEYSKYLNEGKRIPINLTNSTEQLQTIILNQLKAENLSELFNTGELEHYIHINNDRYKIENYIQGLDRRAIQLILDRKIRYHINTNLNLLKLFHTETMSFDFRLKLINTDKDEAELFTIILQDIDINPLAKISFTIPKHLNPSTNKLIPYLKKHFLAQYYTNLESEEFYITLQDPDKHIIYEIFDNRDELIQKYEGGHLCFEYRLQPIGQDELALIAQENKIFVCVFISNHTIKRSSPFVIFASFDSSVGELRERMLQRLYGIKELDLNGLMPFTIKFNIIRFANYDPVKVGGLEEFDDEVILKDVFERFPGVKNIQIEIICNNLAMNNHGLILRDENNINI
jgi:hypothetical protein